MAVHLSCIVTEGRLGLFFGMSECKLVFAVLYDGIKHVFTVLHGSHVNIPLVAKLVYVLY